MAPSGSTRLFTLALVTAGLLMATIAAPPHPPSSPAITAAISPHPQQGYNHHNHNHNHHHQHQQQQRSHHQQHQNQDQFQENIESSDVSSHDRPEDNREKIDETFTSNDGNVYNSAEKNEGSHNDEQTIQSNFLAEEIDDSHADDEKKVGQLENTDNLGKTNTNDDDDLGPALKVLARRKRTPKTPNVNKPYTSSRGRPPSASRYRYPIHRKRSSRVPPQHDYPQDDEDEDLFFNLYEDYPDVDGRFAPARAGSKRPSLFRERSSGPPNEKFLEEALPPELLRGSQQLNERREYNSPLDLEAISEMYDTGKNVPSFSNPESLDVFEDTLESLQRRKLEEEAREEQLESEETELLNELIGRAAEEYYQKRKPMDYSYGVANGLNRRKRNASTTPVEQGKLSSNNKTNQTAIKIKIPPQVAIAEYRARLATDRKKRAFGNPLHYETRKKSYEQEQLNRPSQEDLDDFLTREYFKTIARSVGNKKKRMPYAKFEPDKRSAAIDDFLYNPQKLQYLMDQLKEEESSVVDEARTFLSAEGGETGAALVLRNELARINAIDRMRDALQQLRLQQEQPARKRSSSHSIKRRKKNYTGARNLAQVVPRPPTHRLLQFMPQAECPALARVYSNCESVSELAGDMDQVFLSTCVLHEVCYMCGSGEGVSGHECDALLSSSLEAKCDLTPECLSAAGETFSLLSDARRYDKSGTCAHQPCIKSLFESRR